MTSIHQVLELPNGSRVVISDWSDQPNRRLQNLTCLNADGDQKWTGELPQETGTDCFVGVALDGDLLRANTWSGFALWLDPLTGRSLKSAFTR